MGDKKLILVIALCVAMSVAAMTLFIRHQISVDEFRAAQFLPVPKALPSLKLTASSGNLVSADFFSGHWSLVFFGFTECADICPVELQQLSALLKLAEHNKLARFQVVFISIDPERDTPQKIADYLHHFNSNIIGVGTNQIELVQLSQFFAVDYSRIGDNKNAPTNVTENLAMPVAEANNYQLEHSGRIFLINPHMQYIGSFSPPHLVESMWSDLQMIIK